MIIEVNFLISAIGRKKPEKYEGFNGIQTYDLRDTSAMLDQLSFEATLWERSQFVGFISSHAVKRCEIYYVSTTTVQIWISLNKLTWLPICGFTAQLVEHRTGIVELTGSNPVEALIFFRLLPFNCFNWKIY